MIWESRVSVQLLRKETKRALNRWHYFTRCSFPAFRSFYFDLINTIKIKTFQIRVYCNKINTRCGTDHNIHDKVIFWLTELRGRVRVPPIDCPSPLLREACIGQCPQITFPYLSYFLKRPIRQREREIIKFSCSRWNGDLFCTIVGIFFFRLCLSFRDVGSIRNRQWSCCRDQLLPYGLYWTGGNLIKN